MKAFICLLGILLLVILLFGKLLLHLIHRGDEEEVPVPTPKPHIPVIQLLTNVWIMEADEEGLMIYRDGQSERYPWGVGETGEQTPDGDGLVSGISPAEGAAARTGGASVQDNTAAGLPDFSVREQVADVELTDGTVTAVDVKSDKINGRILSVDDGGVEVEGYGRLPLAADYKGYRLYDSLEMCTADDLLSDS